MTIGLALAMVDARFADRDAAGWQWLCIAYSTSPAATWRVFLCHLVNLITSS
jgi:hypothetical protein